MPRQRIVDSEIGYIQEKEELMNQTIACYDENVEAFCASTKNADMSEMRKRFLHNLKSGGSILDAGCGSGREAKEFLALGECGGEKIANYAYISLAFIDLKIE